MRDEVRPTAPAPELSPVPASLSDLERRLARDLDMLVQPANWVPQKTGPDGRPMLDVVVVGAGMHGIAAAAALQLKGIRNILLLDRSRDGFEGPWVTYARMETLRSAKHLPGPCLGIPALTYRSWYEASFGTAAWEALYKITNASWQDYLTWIRRVLKLPLRSEADVVRMEPAADSVGLHLADGTVLHARRVVLATGRVGTGGPSIPEGISAELWPDRAAHTCEEIDFARLAGKRIAVLGAGASAWDNAATALEAGAQRVDLYCRRSQMPQINKGRAAATPGFFEGWANLDVARKWALFVYMQDNIAPPPHETVNRTIAHPNFHLHFGSPVHSADRKGDGVDILRDGVIEKFDFLIVGTGFVVDLRREPMLAHFADDVATWGDRYQPPPELLRSTLRGFPWLGAGFELQEREPSLCPGASRIHMFNHAATASLGAIASDVPGANIGAQRLASHIASHFFSEDIEAMVAALEAFSEPELVGTPYCTLPTPPAQDA